MTPWEYENVGDGDQLKSDNGPAVEDTDGPEGI